MPGHYGNGNGNGNRTTPTTRATSNGNPVIRLFNAPTTPRYYRPNGSIVPIGAELHEHQDGTIMTEHAMGPNDNSVVVTTQRNGTGNNLQRVGNNASLQYVFADTGEPYGGRVVNIGGIHYSTETGTKQGNSREVIVQRVSIPVQNNVRTTTRANRPMMQTTQTRTNLNRGVRNNQRTARRRTTTPSRRNTPMNRNSRTTSRANTRTTTTRMTRTTRRGSY
tara:strand:- start:197 stop:859 length:663 start_codon:yes stop_codon:yes gene_type:complete